MICPNCQHENVASAKFCLECGTKLRAICPHCGAELPPTAKFCHECGAALTAPAALAEPPSLEAQFVTLQQALPTSVRDHLLTPMEGENRLVTVLFADMSRSVQTTADLPPDEAAALVNELLKAMVDVLLKYEGRVDRFLGDGVLAVFGTPQAHESDPERAIYAALEIREAARQLGLEVTAGINTGEVYAGGVGSERHQEMTVMGPVVNLASRLQGQAEPGQILVGEATYRLTPRAFAFLPLSLEVKGITQPVVAHAVQHALPRPEKTRGIEGLAAELIGRDEEYTKLRGALAEVLSGRGQMVSLVGEAGVGKSRLVSELKQVAGTTLEGRLTPLWLEGRCLELGMSASYWLFVDLFRDYFAFAPDDNERTRGARLVKALKALVERGDLSEERYEEIGPLLGNLMSVRFGTDWDERLKNASPEQIKHQTFLAIRDFFVALARRQPVLLVCEDLHWADSLSLEVIALLMETLTLAPIMLLCAYRPEREHKCWHLGTTAARKCGDQYTEFHLRELTPAQSRRLVESLLTIENLPASVKELILEKSRGNPFFVEEVVRSLIASGMVHQTGEVWRAQEGIESVTVPESVQSVILSRVDRLERKLRGVLESASVIGRLFRRRLLERMMRGTSELERALWELEDHALIYQERVVPEEEYSFKHVMTQETIYGSIVRRRRIAFHQQVAEAMELLYGDGLEQYYEQLAYHYERSGADEKAVEYLLKAGEKTRRAYLNEEAIGYFRRVLDRLDGAKERTDGQDEIRLQALKGLGKVYFAMGKVVEAEAPFRQAIALGQEIRAPVGEQVRLYHALGEVLFWQSRYDERVSLGEEGLALLGANSTSVEAALMNSTVGWGYWSQGRREKGWAFLRRNVEFLASLPYSEELRNAFIHVILASITFEKNPEAAMQWIELLEQRAEAYQDLTALAEVYTHKGLIYRESCHYREAIPHLEKGLKLFRRIGDTKHAGRSLYFLAGILLVLGDLQEAERHGLKALETAEAVGGAFYVIFQHRVLGTVWLCEGYGEKARKAFGEVARLARDIDARGREADALWAQGRTYLAEGERRQAMQVLQEALRIGGPTPAILSALEEACEDPQTFREACWRFRTEQPGVGDPLLMQWFLEPSAVGAPGGDRGGERLLWDSPTVREVFEASLSTDWHWHLPSRGCSFSVRQGLFFEVENGWDFWHVSSAAPALLREVSGDFAVETVCTPVSKEQPAIGGLLVWKNAQNFLRVDRGLWGGHDLCFLGRLGVEDVTIGRGHLASDRVSLRLERQGTRVIALCSADGRAWFKLGHVDFPVDDPLQVSLHAIGNIDRIIYPGAYPDGTAIRFESFELWMGTATGGDGSGRDRKPELGEADH